MKLIQGATALVKINIGYVNIHFLLLTYNRQKKKKSFILTFSEDGHMMDE